MTEKLIGEMSDAGFETMIGAFIDRPAKVDDEIPTEFVFAMLDQREKSMHVLELDSVLIKDRLVISAAPNATLPANVREVVAGSTRPLPRSSRTRIAYVGEVR